MAKSYYVILGIEPDASKDQIKTAYRERVKKYHPDHYGQDSAPFREVQEAYEVLSDPERRKTYDDELAREKCFRYTPVSPIGRSPGRPFSSRRPEVEDVLFKWSLGGFPTSLGEVFDDLWGRFGARMHRTPPVAESISVEIPLTPAQARRGGQIRFWIPAQTQCPTCGGWGDTGFFPCQSCSGTGRIVDEIPVRLVFPGGISNHHTATVPLDRLGLDRVQLIVHFKVNY